MATVTKIPRQWVTPGASEVNDLPNLPFLLFLATPKNLLGN
jgi:hypothetical protein